MSILKLNSGKSIEYVDLIIFFTFCYEIQCTLFYFRFWYKGESVGLCRGFSGG